MAAILEVDAVSKHYLRGDERIVALDRVSFRIDQPSVTAIAGPSGSGKSTLLGMLARFDRPDSGSISVDGERLDQIAEPKLDQYRNRKLGFVFQQFNLVGTLTAQENVELALAPQKLSPAERSRRAIEALQMVGMDHRLRHEPSELSGGQQQRVAIARALVNRPSLVIADEPTGNLDGKTAQQLLELIGSLNRQVGTTFVIATHDQRVMDMAHSVVRLADGRQVA
ncbi:ABC transporter ATP-binding protein [Duganella violaceipulchra]|uniref:ABC transport system ATP-binding protein n=1 Tax=Duganella violaceipulchra TaxID=2849652 RepID=A0AA41H673_9BURK|nr:ABC transporter ATP-binding protein [Duganella violaceicalia]MBV6322627.1 ABC transporter ATP-binding protein [Duganella violaceicalia]MCP2010840.1 putative ABC transport system ATP-binding protein [Duganella violaceicalia]